MSKGRGKQKKVQSAPAFEGPQSVAEVFSATRDLQMLNPYHMDGDIEMYSEEKMKAREQLRGDAQIVKLLAEMMKLYEWSEEEGVGSVVLEKSYKVIQRQLALILRPDIDEEELKFVVDADWEHDRLAGAKGGYYVDGGKLTEALWELVDVWTVGTSRQEYVSFCRLLKKKLQRAIKLK